MSGFTPAHAVQERALEAQFDAALRPSDLRDWMHRLTLHPHHTGSAYDKANMDYIMGLYRSWGFEAHEERFDVLFPTPKRRLLEMTAPATYRAALAEDVLASDATSKQRNEILPTYNAYSPDGDVRGKLVYVNYGLQADYAVLAEHGIDVRGKIVIARYGHAWRGIKPKVAAEHGAIGCILYTDPADDGYGKGDAYPAGPHRSASSVQRGAITDEISLGDPSLPGVASLPGSKGRLAVKDIPSLAKIPTLPISYRDAQPLLDRLGGAVVPATWHGGLPMAYHFGGSAETVHLAVAFNWTITPIYDVIATMRGSEKPDEWIVRGNHADAWVSGAADPISGQVAELAEARSIGLLAKAGTKPKRTLVYCAWDAEEPGLLGSTAFVQAHHDELSKKVALYINTDTNDRGFFGAEGSHSTQTALNEIAREVQDPERHVSIFERRRAADITAGTRTPENENADIQLEALGSGSDYASFNDYYAIPAINLGFGEESTSGGVYHSAYDSFDWFTKFDDPNFAYGITLAKTAGRTMLRFANADVLPYRFTPFATTIDSYRKEIEKLITDQRTATEIANRHLTERVGELAADPNDPYVAPKALDPTPAFDLSPVDAASLKLTAAAQAYDAAIAKSLAAGIVPAIDAKLIGIERTLLDARGLPRRPLFKNQIYEPGYYTGYAAKTMPGIREGIEARNWDEARAYVPIVASVITAFANAVSDATAALGG